MVIKCGLQESLKAEGALDPGLRPPETSLFDKPTRGTSMDEFREMLHSFFKVNLFLLNAIA